ncbi:MAG: SRPBCC domain-containing protein, partial [Phycisphaerales bacterium]|nr:SRPBCC domain-containing protein [Phycisphaerales bacterium]
MITREEDGYWIELHETVAVHHEEVFAALTTTAGLIRWFPVNVEIDLRPGGLIVFGWDATFKHRTSVAILDYDPGGTVVWDWCAAHHDIHAPLYWTVEPQVEEGS